MEKGTAVAPVTALTQPKLRSSPFPHIQFPASP